MTIITHVHVAMLYHESQHVLFFHIFLSKEESKVVNLCYEGKLSSVAVQLTGRGIALTSFWLWQY